MYISLCIESCYCGVYLSVLQCQFPSIDMKHGLFCDSLLADFSLLTDEMWIQSSLVCFNIQYMQLPSTARKRYLLVRSLVHALCILIIFIAFVTDFNTLTARNVLRQFSFAADSFKGCTVLRW